VPTATALVLPEYPLVRRAHVFGIAAALGSIAAAFGPVIGGVVTTQFGWRWIFLINLPLCAVTVLIGARLLHESRDPTARGRPDLFGAALAIGAVGLLTLAIVQGEDWGWGSTTEVAVLVVAVLLGAGFVLRCRVVPDPVLDLSLLRLRFVSSSNATALLWSLGFYAMYFTNIGWLQEIWGNSAQRSGLLYLPCPIAAGSASILLAPRLRRFGPKRTIATGAATVGVTGIVFASVAGLDDTYPATFLPLLVVSGLAIGCVLPALGSATNAYLPANRFAMGSALYTTGRQVGAALGLAIVGALQARSPGLDGYRQSYWYIGAMMTAAAVVMLTTYRRPSSGDLAASESGWLDTIAERPAPG
jgi:MFS family permease